MPKKLYIYGEGHVEPYIHSRVACRAFIERDGELLVSDESDGALILLPGGGHMKGETLPECVIREVREESGYIVEPTEEFLILNEYYDRSVFETHYFICRITGQAVQDLTASESENNLTPQWKEIKALKAFYKQYSKDQALPSWKRHVYQREYTAVSEYIKQFHPEAAI